MTATNQSQTDAHAGDAGGGRRLSTATDQMVTDDQDTHVGGGAVSPSPDNHVNSDAHHPPDRGVEDALLLVHADLLGDLEQVRIAHGNRIRSLTNTWEVDGVTYGKGLPEGLPEIGAMRDMLDQVKAMEHGATLMLKRAMRRHYLAQWVKENVGVGEKQAARLIAAIGDPATRPNPAKLWAYCGLHVIRHTGADAQLDSADDGRHPNQRPYESHGGSVGVAPTRARGQRANWNTEAKSRAYVIAKSCIKQIGPPSTKRRSPYRDVYDGGRAKYADAVHKTPCKRCGPSGNPAAAGSPLSDGHTHARAMRLVMKRILLDLWREARRTLPTSPDATPKEDSLGDAPTSQTSSVPHGLCASGGTDQPPTRTISTPTPRASADGTPSQGSGDTQRCTAGGAA